MCKINNNIAWCMVVLAGGLECFWASGLKYATSILGYLAVFVGIVASFVLSLLVCRALEASTVYAVFVGIGAAGVVVSEIVIFGEPFVLEKIILIAILLIAVIGLKLSSVESH